MRRFSSVCRSKVIRLGCCTRASDKGFRAISHGRGRSATERLDLFASHPGRTETLAVFLKCCSYFALHVTVEESHEALEVN